MPTKPTPEIVERVSLRFLSFRFGHAIHVRRGEMNLRDAAAQCDVSASTLSRLENGEMPDLPTLLRVCGWLGTGVDAYLLDVGVGPALPVCAPPKATGTKPIKHSNKYVKYLLHN